MDHSGVRQEVITEANAAIAKVRDLVRELTVEERDYLHQTSPVYRQLVDTIRDWYSVTDGSPMRHHRTQGVHELVGGEFLAVD